MLNFSIDQKIEGLIDANTNVIITPSKFTNCHYVMHEYKNEGKWNCEVIDTTNLLLFLSKLNESNLVNSETILNYIYNINNDENIRKNIKGD